MKTIAVMVAPEYHQTTTKEKPVRSDKVSAVRANRQEITE